MQLIEDRDDYWASVESIVETRNDGYEGTPWRNVATICVAAFETYDEDTLAILTTAEPYAGARIWPSDVFGYTDYEYPYHPEDGDTYREIAVTALVHDLQIVDESDN